MNSGLPYPLPNRVDDVHVRTVKELLGPDELLARLPTPPATREFVCRAREDVARIVAGEDERLVVVVGPCSVHHVGAALEYAHEIRDLAFALRDRLLIVMRVYFEKPRTRAGWKGLINDPYLDGSFQINEGLTLARQLLLDINHLDVPTATEFVDPITPQYIGDLVAWAAIGARTSESQVHRELASGLSCAVGFKNGTSGEIGVAVNAVVAAHRPHHFLGVTKSGRAAIVATTGNPNCHIILRGGTTPNYDEQSIAAAATLLRAAGVAPRVMVDCSHGNCQGDYRRQMEVAREVVRQRDSGNPHVCGLMLESNLLSGSQVLVDGTAPVPGLSVTDACLDIEDTKRTLMQVARLGTPAHV